jgi:hypothetical protein
MKHLVLAAAMAAIPAALGAQQSCSSLVHSPESGAWSEYDVRSPSGSSTRTRLAVIGAETNGDRELVWVETRAANPEGEVQAITHVLVPGFPYEAGDLQAAVLEGRSGVPVRLTEAQIARARQSAPPLVRAVADACESAELVGQEEVEVPAGKVRARHFRNALRGVDIWVSTDVPFGVVKLANASDRSSMELRDRGGGAKSSLSGPPRTAE